MTKALQNTELVNAIVKTTTDMTKPVRCFCAVCSADHLVVGVEDHKKHLRLRLMMDEQSHSPEDTAEIL